MQLRDVGPSYGLASFLSILVFFLKYLPMSYWLILPIQIIVGFLLLLLLCTQTNNYEYKEMMVIVKQIANKIKKTKI